MIVGDDGLRSGKSFLNSMNKKVLKLYKLTIINFAHYIAWCIFNNKTEYCC